MSTEEKFLDFKCPSCGEMVSFPAAHAGLVEECPLCFESLIVPKDGGDVGGAVPLPLATPRLVLRRLRELDLRDLVDLYAGHEQTGETEGEVQERHDKEEERILNWLQRDREVKLTTPDQSFFVGIELQEDKKLIGCTELRFQGADHLQGGFNVTINPKCRRKGFASEAVAGLLEFCFEGISMHRVAASCDPGDVGAVRMLEKVGMRREGVFLKDRWWLDEWTDTAYYALLAEEYRESTASGAGSGQSPA